MEEYIEDILENNDLELELLDALDMNGENSDTDLSEILANNSELFDTADLFQ